MKKYLFRLLSVLFFVLINSSVSLAQQIDPKIQEVYGDKMQEVMQNDPERIKSYNDLLNNRLKVLEIPVNEKETYPKLSAMGLLNKYNPNIKRDASFDINTFNPLKYDLNFFSTKTEVYRVDNTDYLIVIQPQTFK
jgi:hypothetical protein